MKNHISYMSTALVGICVAFVLYNVAVHMTGIAWVVIGLLLTSVTVCYIATVFLIKAYAQYRIETSETKAPVKRVSRSKKEG